jgi:acyl-CoA dehydrogenase
MIANSNTPHWMSEEVQLVGETARRFFSSQFVPNIQRWRAQGCIDRSLWDAAGAAGLLGASIPEEFGGGGSRAFMAMVLLEQGRIGDSAWGISVHDYVSHYIVAFGSDAQKARWLPRMATGEFVAAIALSEPDAGSDLKAIRTKARHEGGVYRINGQKTFITNGQTANLICVAVKTNPDAGAKGISLLMVETEKTPGMRRGRKLQKIGLHAADTSELFFEDAEVPEDNLLGNQEGKGFGQLMAQLAWERLSIAIRSVGQAEFAVDSTLAHTRQRKIFGQTILDFQNTQFKLAEAKTKLEAMRAFAFTCMDSLVANNLDGATAAMVKCFCTQSVNEIVDECLQLHGGYGFMDEYPIGRLYGDVRAGKIYGGTNEVMKLIIARSMARD